MEDTKHAANERTTAYDFFLYLALLVTLMWLIGAFFVYGFALVDTLIKDTLSSGGGYRVSSLTGAMASLIIVTPFFIAISSVINRSIKKNPLKDLIWVRRWVLYALLFLAFITALGDFAFLLNSFLSGGLTLQFVIKALIVLVVSLVVFVYYLFELRRDVKEKTRIPLFSAIALVVVILGSIVWGFSVAGSPRTQREIKFDDERVQNLQNITWEIENYTSENKALPESLNLLSNNQEIALTDPVTSSAYEYIIIDPKTFTYELCATFTHPSKTQDRGYLDKWNHEVGRQCFEENVRKAPLSK